MEAAGGSSSGLGSASGLSGWASGLGWSSMTGAEPAVASFERPLSHNNLQSLCPGPVGGANSEHLPRIVRAELLSDLPPWPPIQRPPGGPLQIPSCWLVSDDLVAFFGRWGGCTSS